MARGRKKNLSLPPSRSLEHQRAFRARRAHYLAELEERCHRAETENEILRQEIVSLRSGLPTQAIAPDPKLLQASLELMQNMTSTSTSLNRLHEIVQHQVVIDPQLQVNGNPAGPAIPRLHAVPLTGPSLSAANFGAGRDVEVDLETQSNSSDDLYSPNCCAGMMDCRELIDEEDVRKHDLRRTQTSGLRSTSQQEPSELT